MSTRKAGVEVLGAKELRATLKRAGLDLSDLKSAHTAAAQVVSKAAGTRAPRRTGRLASSLRGSGAATVATVRAGGAGVPYANPIHWGWPRRNIAPNPFITEAAQATESGWQDLYAKEVQRIVDKVKGA